MSGINPNWNDLHEGACSVGLADNVTVTMAWDRVLTQWSADARRLGEPRGHA
jgi:hypothetical protein